MCGLCKPIFIAFTRRHQTDTRYTNSQMVPAVFRSRALTWTPRCQTHTTICLQSFSWDITVLFHSLYLFLAPHLLLPPFIPYFLPPTYSSHIRSGKFVLKRFKCTCLLEKSTFRNISHNKNSLCLVFTLRPKINEALQAHMKTKILLGTCMKKLHARSLCFDNGKKENSVARNLKIQFSTFQFMTIHI